MEGPVAPPVRRTLTPAVLASALFLVVCAGVAIAFVAARGGLQMPLAATSSSVAATSAAPTQAPPSQTLPPSTPAPSVPVATPTPAPPTTEPTTAPTAAPTPFDPLFALPACPDHPGCYEYTIARGDSLSGVASRYAIPVQVVLALNPEVTDPATIVVGQILYLGRDPFLRLPPCETVPDCSLYAVRAGDTLSTIAGRFRITVESILAANPLIEDANSIYSGQVIRLPWPA